MNHPSAGRDEQLVIAVDLGTTGLKVGLVSLTGSIAWHDHAPLHTTHTDDGGHEQDADAWWSSIVRMVGAGLSSGTVTADQVVAVSVTGQWASTVPVDASGHPVGPCVLWMDRRGRRHTRRLLGGPIGGYAPLPLVRWVRRTGAVPPPGGQGPIGQRHFLDHDRPAIAAAARWYLEPVDYLTMRFTGEASASHASMLGAFLTDNRRLDVISYDADLVRWSGLDSTKLAPLRPTGSVVGTVDADVAARLGLPGTVRVTTGLPDLHTGGAAAGAVLDGEAHLALGTTSWISIPFERKKTHLRHEILSVPGPTQGGYIVFDNIDTAGACLEWFRRVVSIDRLSPPGGTDMLDVLELAGTSPPGSRGVVFTPWLSGAQAPIADASARGAFHNISLATGPADLARAVLEGVAAQNAILLGAVERFVGRRLDPIRVIGGGARSDLWCRIHADALDRTLERVVDPLNAGLTGAAISTATAIGAVSPSEVRALVGVGATFHPDPAARRVYAPLTRGLRRVNRRQKRIAADVGTGRPTRSTAR